MLAATTWAAVGYDIYQHSVHAKRQLSSVKQTTEVIKDSREYSVPVDAKMPYEVLITGHSWITDVWPLHRRDGSFWLSFSEPAPEGATVDWEVLPIPNGEHMLTAQLIERDAEFRSLLNSEPSSSDKRLAPLTTADFFDGFQVDARQVFRMACFPYDPWSCNIAAKYRDRFADYWSPSPNPTIFNGVNPAPFKGILLITQSENRSQVPDVLTLRTRLQKKTHIDADLIVDSTEIKNANEFWVVIGSEP